VHLPEAYSPNLVEEVFSEVSSEGRATPGSPTLLPEWWLSDLLADELLSTHPLLLERSSLLAERMGLSPPLREPWPLSALPPQRRQARQSRASLQSRSQQTYLLGVRRIGLRGTEYLPRRISAVYVRLNRGSDVVVKRRLVVVLLQHPVCIERMVHYRWLKNTLPMECQIIPITTPHEAQLRYGVAGRPSYSERLDSFGWSRQPRGKQGKPYQATTKQPYGLPPRERSGSSHAAFARKVQRPSWSLGPSVVKRFIAFIATSFSLAAQSRVFVTTVTYPSRRCITQMRVFVAC
jgi:hypothetical protein